MPDSTPNGITFPVASDLVKSGSSTAKLAEDLRVLAFTAEQSIAAGVASGIAPVLGGHIVPQPIPANTDLNDLRATGWYYVRLTGTAATVTNRPPGIGDGPFMFRVVTTPFNQTTQTYYGYSGAASGVFSRQTSNAEGTAFINWSRLGGGGTVAGSGIAGIANMLRVQEFQDFYGPISTSGKGAISLRFDHGLANFNTKIRALLEARNIKYSLALSSRNFNTGENAGVTAAMVNGWALAEVWNHGANSHQDESSVAGLTDQIVTGKAELEAALPGKPIWGYAVPGTGGSGQGGFGGGATPEAFYETGAGDLILTNHAVSTGAFSGTARRIMDGTVRQGMAHFTIEAQTVARIKTEIDNAISNKTGNQLMMHPSLLDTTGYLTTAQLTEVLDYIVTKRNAGELVVLSPYEMMVADVETKIFEQDIRLDATELVTGSGPLYYRGILPVGTDLNTLTRRSDNGVWILASSNEYGNLPSTPGAAGKLTIDGTGIGDTTHKIVWRFAGGTYERDQNSVSGFSGWRRTDRVDDTLYLRVGVAEEVTLANPVRSRGVLPANVDLRSMTSQTWNGIWTVGSANTNPGLPSKPGVAGRLIVENTIHDRYVRLDWREGGGSYETFGNGTLWSAWGRVDNPVSYKGILAGGTALSSLVKARDAGIHIISASVTYPDLPAVEGVRQTGMLTNVTTGLGDTSQKLNFRLSQGVFEREQLSATVFSPWRRVDNPPVIDTSMIEARLSLLEAQQTPETVFENTNIFTSYAEGEAYMDWLARRHKKLTILDLGFSTQGRPIRAFRLGDPTKPTLYVMASQHGDEPMGREAAYIWVRQLAQSTDPSLLDLLTRACIVITPVVNADKINVSRLSSTGTDVNTFWVTKIPKEVQAASKVLDTHDVVLFIDAHEGGGIQMMKTDTPGAPEVAQVIKTQTLTLQDHIHQELIAGGEQAGIYPGEPNLLNSRNAVAAEYKCSSLLLEGPSMLHENMYYPSVAWRRTVYLMTYDAILGHFTANLPAYITAKAAAGG